MKKHKIGVNAFSSFKYSYMNSYLTSCPDYKDIVRLRILDEKVFDLIKIYVMNDAGEYKIRDSLAKFRWMDYEEA